jgi:hypothetical protein
VQMACLGDIVLRVESLMEATKGGVSFGQIAGGCSTHVGEAAACCFQPARSTHVVYESEMQPVGLEKPRAPGLDVKIQGLGCGVPALWLSRWRAQ